MKAALLSLLLSTAAFAQTCDYYPLTTCSQNILGKKTFYDGISVPGGIITDGGTTIQNLTVTGDAGIAGNVSIGGTLTGNDAGFNSVTIGANLSDAGTTGSLTVFGPVSAADAGFNNATVAQLLATDAGFSNNVQIGNALTVGAAAVLSDVGTTAAFKNDAMFFSIQDGGGSPCFDVRMATGLVETFCTVNMANALNAQDAGFLNITAIDGGFQSLAVLGSTVATAANGQAGGQATGVLVEADLVATHADEIIGSQILRHPIVTDAGSVAVAITKAGTTGGTFNVYLKNATNGQILCFDNGVSCTTAAGVVTVSCTLDAGVIGDQIDVHANTTSCTGNDPTAFVTFSW